MSIPLPKLSRAKRGRQNGDPVHSEAPRGKDRSQRKSARDGGWTPTEERKRNELMRQFLRLDGPKGNSEAYRNSKVWCRCGRLNGTHAHEEAR